MIKSYCVCIFPIKKQYSAIYKQKNNYDITYEILIYEINIINAFEKNRRNQCIGLSSGLSSHK